MRILLVEDDQETRNNIMRGLREKGHAVEWAEDEATAETLVLGDTWDVLILDRMLAHDGDGIALLERLRGRDINIPVLILSAIGSVEERVNGLTRGADDYLSKPFAFSELLARLEAMGRRPRGKLREEEVSLRVADLEMDLLSRKVSRGGKTIELQPREFQLLEYLMRNAGRTVTRTMLLEHVWGYHVDPQGGVIDVHVSRLRRKLDQDELPPLIHTVRKIGYMLSPADEAP